MAKKNRREAAAEEPEEAVAPGPEVGEDELNEEEAAAVAAALAEGVAAPPEPPVGEPPAENPPAQEPPPDQPPAEEPPTGEPPVEEPPKDPAALAPIAWDPSNQKACLEAVGIREEHVLSTRPGEAPGSVVIVTNGGRKLRFPGDEALALTLTDSDRDGIVREKPANRIFGARAGK